MLVRLEYQISKLCGSRLWELGAYCDKLVKQEIHSSMIYVNRFIALCCECQWPETEHLMCNFWAMSIKTLGSSQMVILWLASSQVSGSLFLNLSQLSGILFLLSPNQINHLSYPSLMLSGTSWNCSDTALPSSGCC